MGTVLTDPNGWSLYAFALDTPGVSSYCTPVTALPNGNVADCEALWPPLMVADTPVAPAGLNASLATIQRDNGSLQVTLDGWPLYTFSRDTAPGDVTGEGAGDGRWSVARP
jgi:predicted lipoprotein with Yx(FWY)xxD motif